MYLIWSNEHRAWWRPASLGYTTNIRGAGRYTREQAMGICARAIPGMRDEIPPEIPVLETDAMAFLV